MRTVLLAAALAACASPPNTTDASLPDTSHVAKPIRDTIAAGGTTTALVVFDTRDYAITKHELVATAPAGFDIALDYDQLPISLVRIANADALAHIDADPRVVSVQPDEVAETSLAQSLPLINQPAAVADGKTGAGTAVAVLDTGADYRVADLGSCTAVGVPASCRVVYAQDFAPSDGTLDDSSHHGTNTSSIVARVAPGANIIPLDVFSGESASYSVIINAVNWVIANRATYNIVAMNLSLGSSSFTSPCPSDVLATALDSARQAGVLSAVATGNSGVINGISSPACGPSVVSVGAVYDAAFGTFTGSCSDVTAPDKVTCFSNSSSFMTMLAPGALITAGGVTMAGTSQATPHVAGAIAVLRGAFPSESTDDTVARLVDGGVPITDTRNGIVKPRLDLATAAAGCVFGATPTSVSLTGADASTSIALATGASCGWTVASDSSWLTVTSAASGTGAATITVHATANTDVARTANLTFGGDASRTVRVTQAADTIPPTGSVVIGGGATFARVTATTLAIAASDPSGVATMCITNGTTCTTFTAFATSAAWTLAGTQGTDTVHVFLRDGKGNTTALAAAPSDTITFDSVAPASGALTATFGNAQNALAWAAGTDATSGIDHYVVVFATGATAPASCALGTQIYSGSATSFVHTGLANGTTYAYRACAVDRAGNTGAGTTASAQPRPENDPPVGTVTINAGATYTKAAAVTLTLAATDATAVAQVCLSATATCTAWQAFATTKTFSLPATQGERTVNAWFKDSWGNASATPASDTIILDTVAPAGGALTATFGEAQNSLSWGAATDATSGVDHYVVVFATGATAPASCAVGTVAYSGTATSFVHTGLVDGTTYAYRACAVDRAGNSSAGTTATAAPRPESDPPSGTLTINAGATYTKAVAVTLALTATDASTVTQVCLSTAATCTAWTTFAASKAFTLPATQGTRVVNAWFKDQWGNASTVPATASIILDTVAPAGSVLTATAGSGQVSLTWTASTDAGSGLASYRLVALTGTTLPAAACTTGAELYVGTDGSFVHTGVVAGTKYEYRLCARDVAGNTSAGVTATATPTN